MQSSFEYETETHSITRGSYRNELLNLLGVVCKICAMLLVLNLPGCSKLSPGRIRCFCISGDNMPKMLYKNPLFELYVGMGDFWEHKNLIPEQPET